MSGLGRRAGRRGLGPGGGSSGGGGPATASCRRLGGDNSRRCGNSRHLFLQSVPAGLESGVLVDEVRVVFSLELRDVHEFHVVRGDFVDARHDVGFLELLSDGLFLHVGRLPDVPAVGEEDGIDECEDELVLRREVGREALHDVAEGGERLPAFLQFAEELIALARQGVEPRRERRDPRLKIAQSHPLRVDKVDAVIGEDLKRVQPCHALRKRHRIQGFVEKALLRSEIRMELLDLRFHGVEFRGRAGRIYPLRDGVVPVLEILLHREIGLLGEPADRAGQESAQDENVFSHFFTSWIASAVRSRWNASPSISST